MSEWCNNQQSHDASTMYVVDVGSGTGVGSLGMTPVSTSSGRMRACLEAVLVGRVMSVLHQQLMEADLLRSFVDVEMPSLIILARMELNGFGTNLCFISCHKFLWNKTADNSFFQLVKNITTTTSSYHN